MQENGFDLNKHFQGEEVLVENWEDLQKLETLTKADT